MLLLFLYTGKKSKQPKENTIKKKCLRTIRRINRAHLSVSPVPSLSNKAP